MGSYVTQASITTRMGADSLVSLTNTDPDAATVDTDRLDAAIADGEAIVNGYVGRAYQLPLSAPYPQIVVSTAHAVVEYLLWMLSPDLAPESVTEKYKAALEMLKGIAAGTLDLGLDTAGNLDDATEASSQAVRRDGNARRFTRDRFRAF